MPKRDGDILPRLRQHDFSNASTPRAKVILIKHKRDISDSQMLLPHINDSDNGRFHGNCSYVTNHKAYLKQKGYTVRDVYSLKRHQRQNPLVTKTSRLGGSESNLTLLRSKLGLGQVKEHHNNFTALGQQQDVNMWRPRESRHVVAMTLHEYLQALDRESRVIGHAQAHSSMHLGRVLTRAHLRHLLSQEDPGKMPHVDSPLAQMFSLTRQSTD